MNGARTAAERHVPVLAARCLDLLRPALADGGTLVDATLGMEGTVSWSSVRSPPPG